MLIVTFQKLDNLKLIKHHIYGYSESTEFRVWRCTVRQIYSDYMKEAPHGSNKVHYWKTNNYTRSCTDKRIITNKMLQWWAPQWAQYPSNPSSCNIPIFITTARGFSHLLTSMKLMIIEIEKTTHNIQASKRIS